MPGIVSAIVFIKNKVKVSRVKWEFQDARIGGEKTKNTLWRNVEHQLIDAWNGLIPSLGTWAPGPVALHQEKMLKVLVSEWVWKVSSIFRWVGEQGK